MAERIPCPCGDQTRPGHPLSWCERGERLARRARTIPDHASGRATPEPPEEPAPPQTEGGEGIAAKLDHDREWLGKLYRADAERQYLAVVIANMAEAAQHLRARPHTPTASEPEDAAIGRRLRIYLDWYAESHDMDPAGDWRAGHAEAMEDVRCLVVEGHLADMLEDFPDDPAAVDALARVREIEAPTASPDEEANHA